MPAAEASSQRWLEAFLERHRGVAGTVHEDVDGALRLVAAHNIPPAVVARIGEIAHGKGMAGQAQSLARPFQTCNLKGDATGKINPMARAVAGQSAVALPVLDGSGRVRAVVGITFAREGEILAEDERVLMESAATLPPRSSPSTGGVRS